MLTSQPAVVHRDFRETLKLVKGGIRNKSFGLVQTEMSRSIPFRRCKCTWIRPEPVLVPIVLFGAAIKWQRNKRRVGRTPMQ
jgi:hypothetical protein